MWVHLDSGLKFDGRAAEARWVGLDSDSTHTHRIYWQDKNRVSIERDVRFTSNTVTGSVPFPSNTATATTAISDTIAAGSHTNSANNYLPPNAAGH
jgi:hypothetical protein